MNTNWKILGASVRGASHERSGLPNQDAIGWWPDSREGLPIMLAIADGHGSALRADLGAQLAVQTVLNVFQELVARLPPSPDLTACKREAEERLPIEIERDWKKAVERHLAEVPLLPEEFDALEALEGPAAKKRLEQDPQKAYGTTLVSVLVTDRFVLCLQIGDGDLLVVTEDGEVMRPIPDNPLHFANETTSMCMPDSWKDIQVAFQALSHAPPVLFFLATDGYKNAHRSPEGFFRTAREFAVALQKSGPAEVEGYLPELLSDASQRGSGDDISLGLAWRTDMPPLPPLLQVQEMAAEPGAGSDEAATQTDRSDSEHGGDVADPQQAYEGGVW
jgi:hypothetical protein